MKNIFSQEIPPRGTAYILTDPREQVVLEHESELCIRYATYHEPSDFRILPSAGKDRDHILLVGIQCIMVQSAYRDIKVPFAVFQEKHR